MNQFSDTQREEIKAVVHEALVEFFTDKGRLTKNILITTAAIVGAITVIGVGFTKFLALFGIAITRQ